MKYNCFISYSHRDNEKKGKKWADFFFDAIRNCASPWQGRPPGQTGHPVFLDRMGLSAGNHLDPAIQSALEQSDFLVLIASSNSAASTYVQEEITYFAKVNDPLRILIALVDGDENANSSNCAFPPILFELFQEEFPVYVDFRTKIEDRRQPGWTNPADFASHLKKEGKYSSKMCSELKSLYEREHSDSYHKLLASLFSVRPSDLQIDSLIRDKDHAKARALKNAIAALVALSLAILTIVFYFRSEEQRKIAIKEKERARIQEQIAIQEKKRAERSLLLIGDAHEQAGKLATELLVGMKKQELTPESAHTLVNTWLDRVPAGGTPQDQAHMKSVSLNSRANIAKDLGNLEEARRFFDKALELRQELWKKNPTSPIYIHNLAVSHDYFGDLTKLIGRKRLKFEDRTEKFKEAMKFYREGLKHSQQLLKIAPDEPMWRNDLVVSHFKIAELWSEQEDTTMAFEHFQKADAESQTLVDSDPDYPKWQTLRARCLMSMAKLHLEQVEDDQAASQLQQASDILLALKESETLPSEDEGLLNLLITLQESLPK